MKFVNQKNLKEVRQKLRNNITEPELKIWQVIRNAQCCGVKFRRQCSIQNYVVDFFSFEKNLVIEIDGDTHYSETKIAADRERDAYFLSKEIVVIRFTNHEVMTNLQGCFDYLQHFLTTGELWDK